MLRFSENNFNDTRLCYCSSCDEEYSLPEEVMGCVICGEELEEL